MYKILSSSFQENMLKLTPDPLLRRNQISARHRSQVNSFFLTFSFSLFQMRFIPFERGN